MESFLRKTIATIRKRIGKVKSLVVKLMQYESVPMQVFNSLTASTKAHKFSSENLYFSNEISELLHKKRPRTDKFILNREPKLKFELLDNRQLVSISSNYNPINEVRIDNRPYEALCRTLNPVINLVSPTTFLDIGCSSGNLISEMAKVNPKIKVSGIDAFEFLKDAAPSEIRESIHIVDLRMKITQDLNPAEVVTCLEIAEHVDPNCLDQFLSNVKDLTKGYLIMSWSSTYPRKSAPPQHLSPLWKYQYKKVMKFKGFKEERELTQAVLKLSGQEEHFHDWWKKSLIVWSV